MSGNINIEELLNSKAELKTRVDALVEKARSGNTVPFDEFAPALDGIRLTDDESSAVLDYLIKEGVINFDSYADELLKDDSLFLNDDEDNDEPFGNCRLKRRPSYFRR